MSQKVFLFFESFSVSFSDLDKAIEMYAQIQSDETKVVLESSLNADVIMNYYISTSWLYVIDKTSMGLMTPDQLVHMMTLFLGDPSFIVTLDFSDPSSIFLTVTKVYEDDDNLDEIYDLAENIVLNNFGFTLIDSDLNYLFVVDGNILISTFSAGSPTNIPTVSHSIGGSDFVDWASGNLPSAFGVNKDDVIITSHVMFSYFYCFLI
jgi:hypothetical protein